MARSMKSFYGSKGGDYFNWWMSNICTRINDEILICVFVSLFKEKLFIPSCFSFSIFDRLNQAAIENFCIFGNGWFMYTFPNITCYKTVYSFLSCSLKVRKRFSTAPTLKRSVRRISDLISSEELFLMDKNAVRSISHYPLQKLLVYCNLVAFDENNVGTALHFCLSSILIILNGPVRLMSSFSL